MATFNVLEAAVRFGVGRFVNVSSETVPGFFFPERPFLPDYVPVDEEHPIRPQDPYALSKWFGELLMDAAMAPLGHPLHLPSPELGAERGQLRAQPRARGARSRRVEPEPLELRRRVRPRGRDRARRRVRPRGPRGLLHRVSRQRRQPPVRRARPPLLRRRRSRSAPSRARTRPASRASRPSGCSATRRAARGATTSTRTGEHARGKSDRVGPTMSERLKTSLGIWAFGSMATRFVPGGYKPELAERDDRGAGARARWRASAT